MGGGWWGQASGLLGLGMVLLMLLVHGLRKHRFRLASKGLPAVAEELGLTHVAPTYASAQGVLRGTYRGRNVIVDPDDRRALLVRFSGAPRIDLRSYEST